MNKVQTPNVLQGNHQPTPTPYTVEKSLPTVLLRLVLGIYFLIAISSTLIQILLVFNDEKKKLYAQVIDISEVFSPILSRAVWHFDNNQLFSTVQGLLYNPDVVGVQVVDTEGRELAAEGMIYHGQGAKKSIVVVQKDGEPKTAVKNTDILFSLYEYRFPLVHTDGDMHTNGEALQEGKRHEGDNGHQTIGWGYIYTTSDTVISRVYYSVTITVINAIIKTVFLWLIFLIVVTKYVSKPLNVLTNAVRKMNLKSDDKLEMSKDLRTSFQVINHNDELGVLVHSFSDMAEQLDEQKTQLYEYQAQLEQKVRDRTQELEQASRAKSEFLTNMSHEIRTPMNGVLGMAELLLETKLDRKQLHYLNIIQSSGSALLSIINNILDYSKIEANKLEVESVNFNLETLVGECIGIMSLKASEKKLQLLEDIKAGTPMAVKGDPTRIRQVLLNLLSNAFKFTNEGYVVVRVYVVRQTPDYCTIRFDVVDSGIGVTATERKKLFQSFSQADSSTTRKYGGTGLGLAICKRLAELMGGEIGMISEPGQGSTFWFTVKLSIMSEKQNIYLQRSVETLKDKKILIVDDSYTFSEVLQSKLVSWGMRVEHAATAEDALLKLQSAKAGGEPFDLAILDLYLPDINGIDLAHRIVSNQSISNTVLVLISSIRNLPESVSLEGTGISFTLEKPLTSGHLRDTLVTVFNQAVENEREIGVEEAKPFRGLRVLVAEDNEVNQMVIKGQLSKLGIKPKIAVNGLEVLKLFEHEYLSWDLILMDCEMPLLDGYEATQRIRAIEKDNGRPPITIVALSAHALNTSKEKALKVGMTDYLVKPVRVENLVALLEKYRARFPGCG